MELTQEDVLRILPDRKPDSHKGDYGKLLLLCGSRGFTGAAYLAAMGALRSGAGLVYLGVPESIYPIEAVKLNEAIVFPLPEEAGMLSTQALPEILERLPKMQAVLAGPGLGQSSQITQILIALAEQARCPLVLDADGINGLAEHKDVLRRRPGITVLTPHTGEFTRFFRAPGESRMDKARELSQNLGCITVLKGHRTCITDGKNCYENPTGNPGMAVGGSGDVLAGMTVSLLGQKIPALEAAACAAWLHGRAGDLCAEEMGQYGMLPTDMLERLPRLMK